MFLMNSSIIKRGDAMGNSRLFSLGRAICMATGMLLVSITANAGSTYWSVNVGIPVVASPPPVVVYANPAVPITTFAHPAPVVVYPHATRAIIVRHSSHNWNKPRYRNRHHYRRHR